MSGADDAGHGAQDQVEEPHPRGTLLLGVLFLLVLAGAWLLMYFTLIERS